MSSWEFIFLNDNAKSNMIQRQSYIVRKTTECPQNTTEFPLNMRIIRTITFKIKLLGIIQPV